MSYIFSKESEAHYLYRVYMCVCVLYFYKCVCRCMPLCTYVCGGRISSSVIYLSLSYLICLE